MAHGITEKDTAWFHNTPAWHGLGVVSKTRPKTAKQWLKEAGLDWEVEKREVVTMQALRDIMRGRKDLTAKQLLALATEFVVDGHLAMARKDTGGVLGMVTPTYEEFQNSEAFAFLEALLGQVIPETAFSLWEGRQIGALTRVPKSVTVGGDEVRTYIYVRTRHDGTGALWVWPTSVRVVCANTDRMAIEEAGGNNSPTIFKVRHVGSQSERVAQAREALQLTLDYAKQFKKLGDRLAKQKETERHFAKVLEQLWPNQGSDRSVKGQERKREAVMDLFLHGDTRGNAPGSKWSAFNALTEWDQHYRPIRTKDDRVASERKFIRSFEDPDGFQALALQLVTAS